MTKFTRSIGLLLFSFLGFVGCATHEEKSDAWIPIEISDNHRFFQYQNKEPFFWLADTGWLMFKKLDRNQVQRYLDVRKSQGFNVIQVMLLHTLEDKNFQGDLALIDSDLSQPLVSKGRLEIDVEEYDYWDHVEYAVDQAAKRGIWVALVPIWGTPVKQGKVSVEQASQYAEFLANRFAKKPNLIWLNGGDTFGDNPKEVWLTLGSKLKSLTPDKLMTFHPRGRRMSSEWFHNETWLDFNMFQSGHRNYDQDNAPESFKFGPDNWRYVALDYQKRPIKPTLDGEPSYEEIPQGLHDPSLPYWQANDLRRYAYWSVFAGGAGFTYGHNSIMQFYQPEDGEDRAFGAKSFWVDALNAPGGQQMKHLKALMLSRSYFDRVPAENLVLNQDERYRYIASTRGKKYAMFYIYSGRVVKIKMGEIPGEKVDAWWFNPRTGSRSELGRFANRLELEFEPPGGEKLGNDWVLVLESI